VDIRKDIQAALAGDAKEIVLTGVQLGGWGKDFEEPQGLADLLEDLLKIEGYERLRLSSIEPWDFDPSLMGFWGDQRLCRHLHIPLQAGNDRILKAMGRPITTQQFADLLAYIRQVVPEMAITTDVITGFPGESEEDFANTKAFIEEMHFAGGHVFTFSPRPGTAAYQMKEHVPSNVAKARNAFLREVFHVSGYAYRSQFVGETMQVLWESRTNTGENRWQWSGLTDTYIRVLSESNLNLWNQISRVVLEGHHPRRNALLGRIV